MPKLAPFIFLATFLTHDNNFPLYLSRSVKKRALHHSPLLEAAGYLGQGVRAHLRGWPGKAGGHLSGLAGRSPVPASPAGAPGQGRVGGWGCSLGG